MSSIVAIDGGSLQFTPGAGNPLVAPTNVSVPILSAPSGYVSGQTIHTTNGAWTRNPTSFTYQWKSAGVNATGVGATTALYTAAAADVGNTLTCSVVAINAAGSSAPAISAPSPAVASAVQTSNSTGYIVLLAA